MKGAAAAPGCLSLLLAIFVLRFIIFLSPPWLAWLIGSVVVGSISIGVYLGIKGKSKVERPQPRFSGVSNTARTFLALPERCVPVRIRNQSGQEIKSLDDWFQFAPPKRGAVHWQDFRSAKELARSWLRNGTTEAPEELKELLSSKFGGQVRFIEGIPECVVRLDNFRGEQRHCDLVAYCHTESVRIVVSIEAKAHEPFGDATVGAYYDSKLATRSNVPLRIQNLSASLFGRFDTEIRSLRYQLLHSATAALIEAQNCNADIAVFVVHELLSPILDPRKIAQNRAEWARFVHAFPSLRDLGVEENQLLGPVYVPGKPMVPCPAPLYLGHVVSQC